MGKKVLFFLCVLLSVSLSAWAFDWKTIHERADTLTSAEAIELVKETPQNPQARYLLGLVYLNEHKDYEADLSFAKTQELLPDSIEARWGGAEVLRRQHRLEESAKEFEAILKENPLFAPALISLGYIKFLQMDFEETARLTGTVIKQGLAKVDLSNFVRAHSLYAGAKGMLAHYGGYFAKVVNGAAVLRHLKIARKLDQDSPAVFFGYGSYYVLIPDFFGRNPDKAISYLKRALAVDPLFADVYVRLAQAYKLKGDRERYDRYLAKALELDAHNELALDIQSGTCNFICPAVK